MQKGRPTKKVADLKRFAEQWQEYTDEADLLEHGADDAHYVESALHWDTDTMKIFSAMTDVMELQNA